MKNMQLGIAIMLAVIVFHLALTNTYLKTDWLALVGLGLVIKGYCTKEKTAEFVPKTPFFSIDKRRAFLYNLLV